MTIDQWTAFVESLAGDSAAETVLTSGDTKSIVELAQKKGFSFTEQDVLDARIAEQSSELSGTVLESVSGGTSTGTPLGGGRSGSWLKL